MVSRLPKTLVLAVKYALVGTTSAILDIGLLTLLVEYGHLHLLGAAVISFCVGVANGFLWNRRWTFRSTSPRITRQYIKFILTALVGLGLNLMLLSIFVYGLHMWYILAKLIITVLVFFWNFSANRFWTFRDYTLKRPAVTEHPSCDLSVVIPALNEEDDILDCVARVAAYLEPRFPRWEILCIDDGSTDRTGHIIQEAQRVYPSLKMITHTDNRGKGASVRDGVRAACGALILFMDADCSTPITELEQCIPYFNDGADSVIGSRYLKTSVIGRKQPWYRIVLGRIGNLCIQTLLLDSIKDTQCGFKVFTFGAAKSLFSVQVINGWGFDMEVLALAQHMGYRIQEIPVQWHDSTIRKSRLRPIRDAHRTLCELLCIKWNLLRGVYALTNRKN